MTEPMYTSLLNDISLLNHITAGTDARGEEIHCIIRGSGLKRAAVIGRSCEASQRLVEFARFGRVSGTTLYIIPLFDPLAMPPDPSVPFAVRGEIGDAPDYLRRFLIDNLIWDVYFL